MANNAYDLLSQQIASMSGLSGSGTPHVAASSRTAVNSGVAAGFVTFQDSDGNTLEELAFDTVDTFDDPHLVFGGDG
jgi:hypothetical protein